MKLCHLILKHKYFDLVKSGEKDIEYRDNTAYWRDRILGIQKNGSDQATHVCLHRGYTSTTLIFEIDYLIVPTCLNKKIEIHLGKRLEQWVYVFNA